MGREMDEDNSDSDCEPQEMEMEDTSNTTVTLNALPAKSRQSYDATYNRFKEWCQEYKAQNYSEEVLLAYFTAKAKEFRSSTLWSIYSKVKACLMLHDNVDISTYKRVTTYLKTVSDGYQAQKSRTFTRQEVEKFLLEANDDQYLMMKVVLILGIAGGCRMDELTNLMTDNIEDFGSTLIVKIPDKITKLQRTFIISDSEGDSLNKIDIYRKYAALRPDLINHRRFFISYRGGKCTSQVVGKNVFGRMPQQIAKFLDLPNPSEYTGRCFRKTSANVLASNTARKRQRSYNTTVVSSVRPAAVPTPVPTAIADDYIENYVQVVMDASTSANNIIVNVPTVSIGEENGFLPMPSNFMTRAIHVGQEPEQWKSLAVIPPITLSTTFKQYGPGDFEEFEYGRSGNPSRKVLETCLANLEGGTYALAFSSGLGATTSIMTMLSTGDHVISGDDIYGGTNRLFSKVISRLGIESSFVDTTNIKKIEAAIRPNTKLVWIETPTNPTMKINDIQAISGICKKNKLILVVDNSFLTPYLQRPLEFGADLVVYSLTKYMNGHSDVVMGAVVTSNEELHGKLRFLQNAAGVVPSPFDCYLVNRSLKTLGLRMRQHNQNGTIIATFLLTHPKVTKVLHPGLSCHPQHELFKKQTSGHSGMISFYHSGGLEESKKLLKAFKVFTLAESLGGFESLAELPVIMTHASVPEDQREHLGITDNLIRLSVGLEDAEDLIADLSQALGTI